MEEADALGDTVAIMDSGRLRAWGSSLLLKSKFGKGHTVSLLSEPESAARVAEIAKNCIPSAEVVGSDAGNTSLSLPRAAMKGVPRLFAALGEEEGLIKDWGISNTTLEEVFLRLVASGEVNASAAGSEVDFGRVAIVRRAIGAEEANAGDVLCVFDTPNPKDVVMVLPEDTKTMETV
jgi:hypothetical protein